MNPLYFIVQVSYIILKR